MEDKRKAQLKEAWIKNVMRIESLTKELAEEMYDRIKPYK